MNAAVVTELLLPYTLTPVADDVAKQILVYLQVFAHWSSRVNLTTVRTPSEVVQRHFGEGFFLADLLPEATHVLDLGSGAGFPGIPIALRRPGTSVVLAESQSKKSAFLKEVTHRMGVNAKVWAGRAEDMSEGERFNAVVLRAVDNMPQALEAAATRLLPGGALAYFAGEHYEAPLPQASWAQLERIKVPLSSGHIVLAQLG